MTYSVRDLRGIFDAFAPSSGYLDSHSFKRLLAFVLEVSEDDNCLSRASSNLFVQIADNFETLSWSKFRSRFNAVLTRYADSNVYRPVQSPRISGYHSSPDIDRASVMSPHISSPVRENLDYYSDSQRPHHHHRPTISPLPRRFESPEPPSRSRRSVEYYDSTSTRTRSPDRVVNSKETMAHLQSRINSQAYKLDNIQNLIQDLRNEKAASSPRRTRSPEVALQPRAVSQPRPVPQPRALPELRKTASNRSRSTPLFARVAQLNRHKLLTSRRVQHHQRQPVSDVDKASELSSISDDVSADLSDLSEESWSEGQLIHLETQMEEQAGRLEEIRKLVKRALRTDRPRRRSSPVRKSRRESRQDSRDDRRNEPREQSREQVRESTPQKIATPVELKTPPSKAESADEVKHLHVSKDDSRLVEELKKFILGKYGESDGFKKSFFELDIFEGNRLTQLQFENALAKIVCWGGCPGHIRRIYELMDRERKGFVNIADWTWLRSAKFPGRKWVTTRK